MTKTWKTVVITLVIVLAMSFLLSGSVIPLFIKFFNKKSYSTTNCLTERISTEMDIYDIAKLYRDGGSTVAVCVSGENTALDKEVIGHGSGVCVASKGYTTQLENGYIAKRGSYIVTNYHVIDIYDSNDYINRQINILTEDEIYYPAELLWFNQDLDVAIVYTDDVNLNYVSMKDRIVDCEAEDRVDYEQVFTIGTPLELDYVNRLTIGNIASNNPMRFYTTKKIYPYNDSKGNPAFTDFPSSHNSYSPHSVLSNLYEDVVDISLGISPGNSGGGCFDKNGFLIGLTTLGGNVEATNGNQMNGMVSIYPVIKVLDKLIDNYENKGSNKIYTFESLGIKGLDAIEAAYASYLREETKSPYYYLDNVIYSANKSYIFGFDYEGYYIISNNGNTALTNDYFIISCKLNGGQNIQIVDRNDLLYLLLKLDKGDNVSFTMANISGKTKTVDVLF